jgi:hypothetical protein
VIYFLSNCQPYSSFFGENITKYSVAHTVTCKQNDYDPNNLGACIWTFEYTIIKSFATAFNGKIYYVAFNEANTLMLPYPNEHEGIVLREDTTTGKLFRFIESINNEVLICDMSLNEGDTFQLFPACDISLSYWNAYSERGLKVVVDSVRYVNGKKIIYFPNIPHGHFYTNPTQYNISLRFIEGIGPTYGPYGYFAFPGISSSLPLLLCVEKDNNQVFMMHEDLQCLQYSTSVNDIETLKFNIYPNPASDHIFISSDNNNSEITFFICDFIGNAVGQYTFNNSIQIPINNLSNGIYTFIFLDQQNNQTIKKIVIQK